VLRLDAGAAFALRLACDDNVTVRTKAEATLRDLGVPASACPLKALPEPPPTLDHSVELSLKTASADFTIALDPTSAPATTAHLLALAKAGFYKGMLVHRVVPGFVVQFGDPGGDGYGGSNATVRCETSPAPFEALSVGMALSGRDTGSSQMFVTLSRTPHLDGDYAWIGRATGDWNSLAEGDTFTDVIVKE
jgi:cyclophilin family peptidyl-prolyl cis-trans isomerase